MKKTCKGWVMVSRDGFVYRTTFRKYAFEARSARQPWMDDESVAVEAELVLTRRKTKSKAKKS